MSYAATMRSLLRPFLLASVCLLGLATSRSAEAQTAKPSGQKDRSNSQFMLRRGDSGGADAQTARGRARAGDCAGALTAFDAAIAATIDPTLRRDRGLCHEKLGNPFPAIEDYRAYLTGLPEAPDADQIRQRLSALEEQVGVGGPSSQVVGSSDDNPELGRADAHPSFAVDGEGAGETTSSGKHHKKKAESDDGKHSYDYYVGLEKRTDEAEASPLRYGSGFVIGPYLNLPRYFVGKDVSKAFAFNVGATFRYSTGRLVTIITEVGYSGVGTTTNLGGRTGVSLMGGLELRIPVSRFGSDNLLLRAAPGYEHLVEAGTRATTNLLTGRFGFGYRHVFGPAVGLELLVDGGPAVLYPDVGKSRVVGLVGTSFALVVGF